MKLHATAVPQAVSVDLDHAILALSDALDFIGVDEIGHGHRVALMAALCAQSLEWEPDWRHRLVRAALLHDCGVSSTREHRALVDEIVWEGEHAHCERGFAYLGSVPPLAHLAPIVLEHHTPWAHLRHRGVEPSVALTANLIYLVDRADAVHARGVTEGKPLLDVLGRYEDSHFAPELMVVFRDQAMREAFWFVQEEPTLHERVADLLGTAPPVPLSMVEIKGLAGMFGRIIDAKSPYTERHSMGVAKVALRLGRHFGLPSATLDMMEVAALLHDLGKLRIPDELLDKQGPLSAEERRRMARHAFDTYEVLRRAFGDGPLARWAAFHHEYVSGHGYPFHFDNGDLPPEARIIAVADVLQALAQRRPYRQPLGPAEIAAILDGMVFGGKLDGGVVEAVKQDLDAYWQDAVAQEGGTRHHRAMPIHSDFVHLRVHTAYSLSEGAIKVKQLVKLCEKMAMPAVGIADTGNLFGALEFSTSCADAGVQPIVGCQLAVRREGEGPSKDGRQPEPDWVVVLCQSEAGYANLMTLASKAYLETASGETPQVSVRELELHADGLILLTGAMSGPVNRLLTEGQNDKAEIALVRLAQAFPGRTYVELQRHGLPAEDAVEPALVALAYKHDLPLVATNEPYFPERGMYEAHDALICIAEGAYVAQDERRRLTPEHYFKSPAEMRELFADLPEACDNTLVVARRSAFMVAKRKPLLPPYHMDGMTESEVLRKKCWEGLEMRLHKHVYQPGMTDAEKEHAAKSYRERIEYEIGIIEQMGFPGYFLIVSDFIQWSKAHDIPVGPGRGSGAGSAVAWALTITDLDPLRWGLLFERFLNPERVSMPDFDIDFCQDRREETIKYVQDKYGYDHVAQIITFGKLQARAVLRDVGRVLQMPYGQVDRICKMVPNNPANPVTLEQALDIEPLLKEARESDEAVRHLIDMAMKLEGLYRHASTHAAGVVIGDRPLDQLVALYRDPRSDMPVTQFNMKWVESTGLIKFDFLGLKTLTVMVTACKHIKKTKGIDVDLSALPLDDSPTYELLTRGDTAGVFQLESAGMRDVLRKMHPNRLEDLIAVVALYRPGPMDQIPRYIACKHGREEPDYMHPLLEPILKETFGIMVYQEQVMQLAQVLAGYSLGGADLLRRAMGKKIREEMEAQRKLFVDGSVARGVDAGQASMIFDKVAKFAEYGFNKSHAACYALIAYQTAWLKANHPAEFMAATMTYEMSNTDKLNGARQELDRLKIKLLPPDINKSRADFSVEKLPDGSLAVRYALAALKNVGEGACRQVVEERDRNGPYKDLFDFARRLDTKQLNRRQMENMVRAGVFDCLEKNRGKVFKNCESLLRYGAAETEQRESSQMSLLGGNIAPAPKLENAADWSPHEKLSQEFDAIGFYLSAHPLDAFAKSLKRLGVIKLAELPGHLQAGGKGRVKLAGSLLAKQERTSAKGSRYAFLTLSDASGMFEVTVFSETLAASRELLEAGGPLLLEVDAKLEEEQLRLTCQRIASLDQEAARAAAGLKIFIRDEAPIPLLAQLVEKEGRGRNRILIVAQMDKREVELGLGRTIQLNPAFMHALRSVAGVVEVEEI